MTAILQDLSDQALAEANEANACAFFRQMAIWPRLESHDDADMLWFICDIPFPVFNTIMHTRLAPDELDARIAATVARYRARGLPAMWWTGPGTQPAETGPRLEAHGFVHVSEAPLMAVDLRALHESAPAAAGLAIEAVRNEEDLRTWRDILVQCFEFPDFSREPTLEAFTYLGLAPDAPLQHFLARLDGQPVATSSLMVGAGVGGVYNVATLPAARGRGIGAAVTRAALLEARERGYRAGILQSSEMGLEVYRRLGFRENGTMGHYVLGA